MGAAVSPPVEAPVAAAGKKARSNDAGIRRSGNNRNGHSHLAAGCRGQRGRILRIRSEALLQAAGQSLTN
jgi:hypothetical protein